MGRLQKDAKLIVSKALPAATANNNSPTIDLGSSGYKAESYEVEISIPAIAAHITTSSNITIKLQDSADDSSYADTDPVIQTVVAGVASTGSAAKTVRFRLPSGTRRYIQFNQACGATDAMTASSITYSLLF